LNKNAQKAQNVLDMIPVHNMQFEKNEKKIDLLEPRFKSQFSKKYISRLFQKQYFYIHLDEFGSFVWQQIDGKKTVLDIANDLKHEFGQDIEPVYERLGLYINMLAQRRYIILKNQD